MRLQNYGRLVKVQNFPEPSQSSRVLIKSSDSEGTRNAIRSLDKSDTKQNKNFINQKNKITISTQRNRILTTESQQIDDTKNRLSVQSYSFNVKGCCPNPHKDSIGQTYGSMDQSLQYDIHEGGKGYSRIQYKLRVQSLTRQYELKIRKQKQLHELQLWKMGQQINDLRKLMQKLRTNEKQKTPVTTPIKAETKDQYCHLCSNGQIINSLTKINKQLEQTHKHCIKNQNQYGIRMLQLEQESLKYKQKLDRLGKQNMSMNEKTNSLAMLNESLTHELNDLRAKLKQKGDDLKKEKQRYESRQKQIKRHQDTEKERHTQSKPKQKLERLSYNDISILQPQNTSNLAHLTTNSKSIGNISTLANQYRRQTASYMSGMKKHTDVENLVDRVKSLSTLNYRPVIQRKQRRYY